MRFSAPSPARRRPRLFQDLLLQLQLGDPAAQPGQLGPLLTVQGRGLRLNGTAFLAQRPDPVAQGLVVDADLPADLAD